MKSTKLSIANWSKENVRALVELLVIKYPQPIEGKIHGSAPQLASSANKCSIEKEVVINTECYESLNQSLSFFEVEDEKLGFVKDGWLTLIVKITLLEKPDRRVK